MVKIMLKFRTFITLGLTDMLKKIFFLFLFSSNLFSITLNPTYFVNSDNIKLRDIIPDADYDIRLYKIEKNRYSKKVKSKNLIQILSSHGYKEIETSSRYIKFIKKSPIDLSSIKDNIILNYKKKYPAITIHSVEIIPRGYITTLAKKYQVIMPKKFHLSNKGTLHTKTLQNKKVFFDYLLNATLQVHIAKKNVRKGDEVSFTNTKKQKIQLHKLKAIPITSKDFNTVQFKRNLKENKLITEKDVQALYLVKKGSSAVVNINNNNINISFSAKALQSGKLHDIITVQKRDMKRLRVQVIGKNQVTIK